MLNSVFFSRQEIWMSNIIDGRAIAKTTYQGLRKQCESKGIQPHLTVILVGDDPASKVYVGRKGRIAKKIGFSEQTITLPESTTEKELLELLEGFNKDESVDGILVQLQLFNKIILPKTIQKVWWNVPKHILDNFGNKFSKS